jgi:hypothetical protein
MPAIDELNREHRAQVMGGNANAVLKNVATRIRSDRPVTD